MKKNTKRTLLFSVLALILCSAMLIGTTFAWFTDSASTAVNKIQAGTLDIGLEMKTGTDAEGNAIWSNAEGQTLAWQKAAGAESETVLWEPGCTYTLPTLKITNKGNLALQFKILVNSITGDLELLNALEFTCKYSMFEEYIQPVEVYASTFEGTSLRTLPYEIPFDASGFDDQNLYNLKGYPLGVGEIGDNSTNVGYYTIEAHMKESAGNEYQGKKLENLAITVVATQSAGFEYDSFDDTYDKDAKYPVVKAMVLSDPATRAEVMKEDAEDPDVGLHPVFEGNTYSVPGKTLVTADETFSRIDFVNANVTCDTLINVTNSNTVMISDCSITLSEGGKLVVSTDRTVQVLIVGNVTVNGVKLTRENCGMGTALYNQYFQGIGTCFFY